MDLRWLGQTTRARTFGGDLFRWSVLATLPLLAASTTFAQGIPGYGGPGVATQGGRAAGNRGSEPVSIRPYASVMGVVDNGVIAVGLDENGNLTNPGALYGVQANVGVYGSKSWRRNTVGLDYQGSYRHYSAKTFYNGSDHLMSLHYGTQLSRRSALSFRSTAGTSSRTTGGLFGMGFIDPNLFPGTTLLDLFDNRAYFADVSGDLNRQIGSRTFVSAGGGAFAVRRQSKALVGLNGQRATGAINRQLSRRTFLGANYQYMHVDYPRVFGEADVHTVMLQMSRQFGRQWNLTMAGGVFRIDFAGVRTVEVDPVIAELFGLTTGREAFNAINVSSSFSASLSRSMRSGYFGLSYARGANPGNGVLLVNRQERFGANYTYNTRRFWSFSVLASMVRMAGIGAYSDRLGNYSTSFVASRKISSSLHFTAAADARQFTTGAGGFSRLSTRVSAGVTYSPGELPISLR
ncbi:MAG: hypothetical protein JNK48_10950 [Bryobacterales bacterium]|nr:hypothetical protein [Bryobacterales bacterium]